MEGECETMGVSGLTIEKPVVIGVTNNLRTFKESGIHHISVNMFTDDFKGIPKAMEPEKCEEWFWVKPQELPQPHFDASEFAVECFLKKQFYIKNQK